VLLVNKLLDDLRKRIVVEGELLLEYSIGQAAALFGCRRTSWTISSRLILSTPIAVPLAVQHVLVHRSPGNPARPVAASVDTHSIYPASQQTVASGIAVSSV
jgi:hypothetical protein